MASLLIQLTAIISLAAIIALLGRAIKQPPIIAYLIAGVLIGPLFLNILSDGESISAFAHIGVAFLLFIVGLSLDLRVLKEVGKISFLAGFGALIAVSAISFVILLAMGFTYTPALYLAAALAFSSTVVVVKLLSDKKEIDTLHGRIALGILIIEDFVAAIVLMLVPVLAGSAKSLIFLQLGKAILLILAVFAIGRFVLPFLLNLIARNQEILFLFSIAWALIIAITFETLGFSLEIGALIAGMSLAQSKFALEISSKVKGVRDFFVVLFFVYFGAQLSGPITSTLLGQALIFSAFILVGKPIIVMTFMRLVGYKKRINFFTGISLAQISEFSLVLVLLGYNLGQVPQSALSLILLVAIITIALSSYSTHYSHSIFEKISKLINVFDGKKQSISNFDKEETYEVVLFGCNRIGYNIMKAIQKSGKKYIIVDYNPKIVIDLAKQGINCAYGDANDRELLEDLRMSEAKIVISTIPDLGINLKIKSLISSSAIFIPTSHFTADTEILYKEGADYVLMPHFLGGEHTAHLLTSNKFSKSGMRQVGVQHRKELKARDNLGHKHPSNETNS
ncbi:MAG: cation:proton antiporter family protein [Nanoarchaeota archaeon]